MRAACSRSCDGTNDPLTTRNGAVCALVRVGQYMFRLSDAAGDLEYDSRPGLVHRSDGEYNGRCEYRPRIGQAVLSMHGLGLRRGFHEVYAVACAETSPKHIKR